MLPPPETALLALLPILLVASAICSGTETALFSLTHRDRRRLAATRPVASARVERVLQDPRRLLVTVLLLNMTVNVTYFVASSVLSLRASGSLEALLYGVVSLAAIILLGEILAKLFAGAARVAFSAAVAPGVLTAQRVLGPLLGALDRFAVAPLTRVLAGHDAARPIDPDELGSLIRLGMDEGAIASREQRLLAGVLELGSVRVREVMIPRPEVLWIDADLPSERFRERVIDLVRDTRHTKFPIARGDLDELVGLLNAKAYLGAGPPGAYAADPGDHAEPVVFVPENARLDRTLDRFRDEGLHLAMVVDERGEVSGLIEIEDIVELLLHESRDPAESEELKAELVGLGAWSVPGRLPVRDWATLFGIPKTATAARASTVGGLVFAGLGRVPNEGDRLEFGPVQFIVREMNGLTVERVEVRLTDAASAEPEQVAQTRRDRSVTR
ncbi:MAG: hemolysin family protein [Planctomycetota bacterium]